MRRTWLTGYLLFLLLAAGSAAFGSDSPAQHIPPGTEMREWDTAAFNLDLLVGRLAKAKVLGATPYAAPPSWNSASDWLSIGGICRDATMWYTLESPESLVSRGIVGEATKWVSLCSYVDFITYAANNQYDQWIDGDHTTRDVALDYPAFPGTLRVDCFTDPLQISNQFEWREGTHWTPVYNDQGYVVTVRPLASTETGKLYKWFIRTSYRFRFYPIKAAP